jgi:hypothetical protein
MTRSQTPQQKITYFLPTIIQTLSLYKEDIMLLVKEKIGRNGGCLHLHTVSMLPVLIRHLTDCLLPFQTGSFMEAGKHVY